MSKDTESDYEGYLLKGKKNRSVNVSKNTEANDDKWVGTMGDTSPSNAYPTLENLLRDSRIQGWADVKLGRLMLRHFGHLVSQGKALQNQECNVCGDPMSDIRNVGQVRGYIVHRGCAQWPRAIHKVVKRSLKAYDKRQSSY